MAKSGAWLFAGQVRLKPGKLSNQGCMMDLLNGFRYSFTVNQFHPVLFEQGWASAVWPEKRRSNEFKRFHID